MNYEEIVNYIEDKPAQINDNLFFHATSDIDKIKKILEEGIKCSFLRGEKSQGGYNGKYYICVGKISKDDNSVYNVYKHQPKVIIDNIKPILTKKDRYIDFINSILPFREGIYKDEYQYFLMIKPSKFVAIEYSLNSFLLSSYEFKNSLNTLKQLIIYMSKHNINLPIYDFLSNREINQEKVLTLNIH